MIRKSKILIGFSLVIILTFSACSSMKDLMSKGQEELKLANNAYAEGHTLKALVHATNALVIDPEFLSAKEFLRENFDIFMKQATANLMQLEMANTAAKAEERYAMLDLKTQIYTNLQKITLPLNHPKNKWTWTTEIIDYSTQKAIAKDQAYSLLIAEGREFISNNRVKEAEASLTKAINLYTKDETHKLAATQLMVEEICFHASRILNTSVIEDAIIAHEFFRSAAKFSPNDEEAKTGIINSAIYASYLYLERGNMQEESGDINLLKAAHQSYVSAVQWDDTNEHAIAAKRIVTEKIADYYYRLAVRAENAGNIQQAVVFFENVCEWLPEYKMSMVRMYHLRIGAKIENISAYSQEILTFSDAFNNNLSQSSLQLDRASLSVETLAALSVSAITLNRDMTTNVTLLNSYIGIPVVDPAVSALRDSVLKRQLPVTTLSTKFNDLNIPVLVPAITTVDNTKALIDDMKWKMEGLFVTFKQAKDYFVAMNECLPVIEEESKFKILEQAVDSISDFLVKSGTAMKNLNDQFQLLEKESKNLQVYAPLAVNIQTEISSLNNAVMLINPAVEELKATLDKEYLLAGYKMTARKFLMSPPIPIRIVQLEYNKMILGHMNPKIKNLEINFPEINDFSQLIIETDKLDQRRIAFDSILLQLQNNQKTYLEKDQRIKSGLDSLKIVIPCEVGKKEN